MFYKIKNKYNKFYGSKEWRELRLWKLAEQPLCEYCLEKNQITPATEIDHVLPLATHWHLRLDHSNMKSTCRPCHLAKTSKDGVESVKRSKDVKPYKSKW